MPTYDYQCEACGRVVEVFHAMSESGPDYCTCQKKGRMRRLLSAGSGLIFKGSGFYITDYARKNAADGSTPAKSANASSSSAPPAADSSSKSESSSSTPSGESKNTSAAPVPD